MDTFLQPYDLTGAFSLVVGLAGVSCLVFVVPLWGPGLIDGESDYSVTTDSPLHFRAADMAGLIPLAIVVLVPGRGLPDIVVGNYGFYLCALLGILLWTQSVRYANSHGISAVPSRILIVGIVHPLTSAVVSLVGTSGLMTISAIMEYEAKAKPLLIASSSVFAVSLFLLWGARLALLALTRSEIPANAAE